MSHLQNKATQAENQNSSKREAITLKLQTKGQITEIHWALDCRIDWLIRQLDFVDQTNDPEYHAETLGQIACIREMQAEFIEKIIELIPVP